MPRRFVAAPAAPRAHRDACIRVATSISTSVPSCPAQRGFEGSRRTRPPSRDGRTCNWRGAGPLAIGWSRPAFAIARVSRNQAEREVGRLFASRGASADGASDPLRSPSRSACPARLVQLRPQTHVLEFVPRWPSVGEASRVRAGKAGLVGGGEVVTRDSAFACSGACDEVVEPVLEAVAAVRGPVC
jgi:hypothetical protein